MLYLDLNKKEQISLMKKIKEKSGVSWKLLQTKCGVKRSILFYYISGESKIPKEVYETICKTTGIEEEKQEYIVIKNKIEKIRVPQEMDSNLAELIGILAGDGHLSDINYEVSVSGSLALDKNYIEKHVSTLFQDLFLLKTKIKRYEPNNNIRSVINSKMLVKYLATEFKIPTGKKLGKLHVPKKIKQNKEFKKAYIRGLFDTDGSIYLRREKDLVVSIISADKGYLEEINHIMIELGYKTTTSGKNLYLYNQDQIREFFKEFKPANEKHQKRYDRFINKILTHKDGQLCIGSPTARSSLYESIGTSK